MKGPKRVVDAYITPIVNAAIDAKSSPSQIRSDSGENTQNMLEYLVSETEGIRLVFFMRFAPYCLWDSDPNLVRDTLLTFLLAGRDTVRKHSLMKG